MPPPDGPPSDPSPEAEAEAEAVATTPALDPAAVEAELDDVAIALDRLDAGTYGTCEACGAALPDEVLAAAPAARWCAAHQPAATG